MNYKDSYNNPKYKETLAMHEWYDSEDIFWLKLGQILSSSSKIVNIGAGASQFDDIVQKKYDVPLSNYFLLDLGDYRKAAKNFLFQSVDLNFDKLPLPDNSQDLVFCMQTIEHVENPHHLVREIKRILKSGGNLVISMPNGWSIFSRIMFFLTGKIYRFHRPNTQHISFLSKRTFEIVFQEFKLEATLWRKNYLFEEILLFALHDYRGRLKWLSNIKIPLPRHKLFSSDVLFFFEK